jgi:hypothetical protein
MTGSFYRSASPDVKTIAASFYRRHETCRWNDLER